ncbi:DUF1168-domain-containing protein [Amniculicola lignicola CBS 123094]|uniref:DUF1168-domain-containing protein n=1 Tax=Amniculicola lignicola CBS 123094 TaxID=1392246 RepID=A0A6A5WW99_9PLEO|nr:DUF1168-domain-containing protein [Amniculicola lignicola CBS 123094]
MSEPIPESIPTSADPRSKRPTKKRALTPRDAIANQVEALFANPDREIKIPTTAAKSLAAPPELVTNVQGSSAGAGSGEFHVYKASRRREYERLRVMDEEVKREEEEKAYAERKLELEQKDREKTERNRLKRAKAKARQEKKRKNGGKGDTGSELDGTPAPEAAIVKKVKRNPAIVRIRDDEEEEEENDGGEVQAEVGLIIHDDD